MAVINVDIISDPVCVWCFVGKRTLNKAVTLYQKTYPGGKNDTFNFNWQPYYLGYTGLLDGPSVDKSEIEKIKFKDVQPETVQRMRTRMTQVGKTVGINYKYGGKIGHTRDSHRLIHYTQSKYPKSADGVLEGIFSAFHEQERDIADINVLRGIAEGAGMNGEEVLQYLESDEDADLIDKQAQANRDQVTTGVPTFLVQGEHRVDGAQDLQEFLEAFIAVKEGKAISVP